MSAAAPVLSALEVRVRGVVQGVGFRPTVWRLAQEEGLRGEVRNDGDGVLIRVGGAAGALDRFLERLRSEAPPLARIESIESRPLAGASLPSGFSIVPSARTEAHTAAAPDAATCAACREEVQSPFARRYRYPFTNCTHCGPRFSILRGLPYDRAATTMAGFALCAECLSEYEDPADRRFHAQPMACHRCGPRARLVRTDGAALTHEQFSMLDDVDAVATLLMRGAIVAIRGLGGFHLSCDATQAAVVEELRARKERRGKPFALMARDLDVIRRYARVDAEEERLLQGPENPIVLLRRLDAPRLPAAVSPGLDTLGFMLAGTPLHHLILKRLDRPVVMTSGNPSGEPQAIANDDALTRLAPIAPYALLHDRDIETRLDDSVARVVLGVPRLLRRARGYAPAALPLPPGFEASDGILALGAELKSTFCLVKDGAAILSPHHGDLEDAHTYDEYVRSLESLGALYQHRPRLLAADAHPEYLSSKLGRARAAEEGIPLVEVQHHHAHVAAGMVEHGLPRDTAPVLGVALDGLGYGGDGTLWGGEFLLCTYRGYERLGTFKPVALLGGAQAMREPWRNTYAHLLSEMGWVRFAMNYRELPLFDFLESRPRAQLDRMLETGTGAPLASSCGRLFDAVAAALGLCREKALFEGQAAMELEAIVDEQTLREEAEDDTLLYPFSIPRLAGKGLPYVEPLGLWQALLGDLIVGTPAPVIAARFHRGLAHVVAAMVKKLLPPRVEAGEARPTVVLGGGCFQNRILLEETVRQLGGAGLEILSPARVPAYDGGIALGQAAIAAAWA